MKQGWLITFPQGTTSNSGTVRKGTSHIILNNKPLVIPIVINGFADKFEKKSLKIKNPNQDISIIDSIYILITMLSLIKCYKKGFVLSILSMAKWLLAYILTLIIFPRVKPFLKDVNSAALAFIKAIEKNKKTYVYPWQMNVLTKLINLLPQFIIDSLVYRSKNRITKYDKN